MSHIRILEVLIWECFVYSLRYTVCCNNMLNYTNSDSSIASFYLSTCLKWFVCYATEAEFCSLILCCFVTYTPQLNYAPAHCWCIKLGHFPKSRSKRSSALIGNRMWRSSKPAPFSSQPKIRKIVRDWPSQLSFNFHPCDSNAKFSWAVQCLTSPPPDPQGSCWNLLTEMKAVVGVAKGVEWGMLNDGEIIGACWGSLSLFLRSDQGDRNRRGVNAYSAQLSNFKSTQTHAHVHSEKDSCANS